MSDCGRREFIGALTALGVAGLAWPDRCRAQTPAARAGRIHPGYAAITWGGNDDRAIDEIAEVGFKAIQLRATAFDAYGSRPAALQARLAQRGLRFAVLSSGNLKYQREDRDAQLALHLSH